MSDVVPRERDCHFPTANAVPPQPPSGRPPEFQLLRFQSWGRCLADEAFELLINLVLQLVSVVTQRKNHKTLREYSALEYPVYLVRKQQTFSIRGQRESILGSVGSRSVGLCCKASVPLMKKPEAASPEEGLPADRSLEKHDCHSAPSRTG